MKYRWLAASTGFALFSMFFGSGNLVFPISVGQQSDGHYLLASLGILMTGVIVPFFGVFGMILYRGDIKSFFSCFGSKGTFWFSFLALALMGPFGVLARCLTVAHGAFQLLFPSISLPITSAVLCLIIYTLAVKKNKIVPILGTILTPLLLVSIFTIAICGLKHTSFAPPVGASGWPALKNGFLQGYQTMDLLAAFFFSTFVINHLTRTVAKTSDGSSPIGLFFKASLIGAGLLSVVYLCLVALGWTYASALVDVPPQELLGRIAVEALGSLAAPCVSIVVILACLTTSIVLASLFAEFLRKEIAYEKIKPNLALGITLLISFVVSTFEFSGIAKFLGPILETVYPALIVLTFVNIAHKQWGFRATHWPATVTVLAKFCFL